MRRSTIRLAFLAVPALLLLLVGGPSASAQPADDQQRDLAAVTAASAANAQPAGQYGHAVWMRIPRIGLDSAISDVGVQNGEYGVPWWEVGRHADSAQPGEPGNSVYNGHVQTLHAGQVFAKLHELTPGDAIYIYTPTLRLGWVVTETFTVPNWNNDFLRMGDSARITLYTCTGAFNPVEQNFADRLVVVARFAEIAPLQ